jgi:hypothetical protein
MTRSARVHKAKVPREVDCHDYVGYYVPGIMDKAEFARLVDRLVDANPPYTEQDVHYRWLRVQVQSPGSVFDSLIVAGTPGKAPSFKATCIRLEYAPLVEEEA